MKYPSKIVENAVEEIAKLPSIGRKTALRLALFLLKQDEKTTVELASALIKLRTETQYCTICHHIADAPTCHICTDKMRDKTLLCIVENTTDILAIENTGQYNGLYHVLGGVISPINGVSPTDLNIDSLLQRFPNADFKEVIFALSATMEGDTTAHYLTKKLQPFAVKISSIARGVPIGSELEYTDEITLGRSILSRIKYE